MVYRNLSLLVSFVLVDKENASEDGSKGKTSTGDLGGLVCVV